MSTHHNKKQASKKHLPGAGLSFVNCGFFMAGGVAGAALLMRSMRLQSEMQEDALHVIREQLRSLAGQLDELAGKVGHLGLLVDEFTSRPSPSSNTRDAVASENTSAAGEGTPARASARRVAVTPSTSKTTALSPASKRGQVNKVLPQETEVTPKPKKKPAKRARSSSQTEDRTPPNDDHNGNHD